jgi:hypothetical protein
MIDSGVLVGSAGMPVAPGAASHQPRGAPYDLTAPPMPRKTTRMEERYRPYRSARRREKDRGVAKVQERLRPARSVGMRLYMFPPDTTARRRRFRVLILALLAVTAWGVVSVRRAQMGLAEYRAAAAELAREMPYLIAAGPAVVSGMLESPVPRDRSTAWYMALLDRVRSLVPR